ncbi:MAG: hypothetical protein PHF25_03270 [Candidatus Margulisbacteria bacterium]|nr:hypothetical protein [Candidatus Margulisiibacteriota bacterium]
MFWKIVNDGGLKVRSNVGKTWTSMAFTIAQKCKNLNIKTIETHQKFPVSALYEKIINSTQQITIKDFIADLNKVSVALNRVLSGESHYAVIWGKPHTSRRWVWHMVEKDISHKPYAVSYFGLDGQEAKYNRKILGVKTYVITDDASYSGTQIKATIRTLARLNPRAKFIVAIPYVTDIAARRIKSKAGLPDSVSIELLSCRKMPTLRQILTTSERTFFSDEKNGFGSVYIDKKKYELLNTTATVFQHKIGDVWSVYSAVSKRFDSLIPPYKNVDAPYYKAEKEEYLSFINSFKK